MINKNKKNESNEIEEIEEVKNESKASSKPLQNATKTENDSSEEDTSNDSNISKLKAKAKELKQKLESKEEEFQDCLGRLQRLAAEFDNFKKRTAKEKEAIYKDTTCEVISSFLPVVDNFERALASLSNVETQANSLKEGVEMVFKQLNEVIKSLGVEEIRSLGETFNPEIHNAVMHIEDENFGENAVIEEFQKGYILKEKVIRHSMVKVAN